MFRRWRFWRGVIFWIGAVVGTVVFLTTVVILNTLAIFLAPILTIVVIGPFFILSVWLDTYQCRHAVACIGQGICGNCDGNQTLSYSDFEGWICSRCNRRFSSRGKEEERSSSKAPKKPTRPQS